MKQNLLTIFILSVVLSAQAVTPTLHLIQQVKNMKLSRDYCRAKYTDLAPVKTYDDLLRIRDEAARQGISWPVWIGLYNDVDSWRWSFHDLPLSIITLRKWSAGEPDNVNGIEQCAQLSRTGTWRDSPCKELKPFICYNAQYPGDSRFVGITFPELNWTDAQAYCRRFHTDLATALDESDNSLLQQTASAQGDSWFGLYRDGWNWLHDSIRNIYWNPGTPSVSSYTCGGIEDGLLTDLDCFSGHYFFCHYAPPIKRKMVKLQVRSDQNVFDAAVQSSLLMKIMQKLKEHGMMQNTTVTWRVQPDGNIFHKTNDDL